MSRTPTRSLFFYQGNKLITVMGDEIRAILRHADMPLAELSIGGRPGGGLLATDDKGSVLVVQSTGEEP
ncbi:hypothetical protein ACIPW4_02400 [Pseudomonas sp. NPDC089996]|uniref:hypothetical protein n=1 Tax=Pseudomonas sp. NPDC089996 TaxID=3364474 RepID=UPI0038146539